MASVLSISPVVSMRPMNGEQVGAVAISIEADRPRAGQPAAVVEADRPASCRRARHPPPSEK